MANKIIKKWDDMTFDQKRHTLVGFLKARTPAFWKVCGKDVQLNFVHTPFTPENINFIRDDIVSMYKHCLAHSSLGNKETRLDYMERHLLK